MPTTSASQLTSDTKRQRLIAIGVLLFCLSAPFAILYFNSELAQSQSLCPLKLTTGMPCPGCGMLKSWAYLTHGHLHESLDFHLFGPGAYLAALFLTGWLGYELWQNRSYQLPKLVKIWAVPPIAIGLFVYHAVRLVDILQTPSQLQTLLNQGMIVRLVKATMAYFGS